MPAIAEYRTCRALRSMEGLETDAFTVIPLKNTLGGKRDFNAEISKLTGGRNNEAYSHNTYYRLKTLSEHMTALSGGGQFTVLDIGGGEGDLCLFLPDAAYVLAEPSINGISGQELAFEDKSFDFVVAVHDIFDCGCCIVSYGWLFRCT